MWKVIQMWFLLRSFDGMQASVSHNDLNMSLHSASPYINRKHLIYLYALNKNDWFLVRWLKRSIRLFKKHIQGQSTGIFIDKEIESLNFGGTSLRFKKEAEKGARLLRKAQEFNPKLLEIKVTNELKGSETPMEHNYLIRLTQAGEDFVKLSELLNYIVKKYQPLWLSIIIPTGTFLAGIKWREIWDFIYDYAK